MSELLLLHVSAPKNFSPRINANGIFNEVVYKHKNLLSKLPPAIWPQPHGYGLVLQLDAQGNIIQSLHDPTGNHLTGITSAQEYGDYLYLGSLHNDRIGKYKLQ